MNPPVGRFAPTPSGPLHLGSLVTALGSWLSARAGGGRWHLRIDDLDRPRVQRGAESLILRQLEAHGLHWDGAIRRQSEHLDAYLAALARLRDDGLLYACTCTRATLAQGADVDGDERVYAGTCRESGHPWPGAALRLRVPALTLAFDDAGRGHMQRDLRRDVGDFIVRRRDGQIAYQLACAVDEAAQGITDVVRGADLIGSTFRQLCVMRMLGLASPRYRHLPLLVDPLGRKLSKQNAATALDTARAADNLRSALEILGQPCPAGAGIREILDAALQQWIPERIPAGPVMSS